ncbi:MAG: RNA methyltransferase [Myxococcota bacterium]
MPSIYCALVHHPVLDRRGEEVTSAVTNVDVHDIARSARTYGLDGYFVVAPVEAQRRVVQRILDHWSSGPGAQRLPSRRDALALCRPVESLAQVAECIWNQHGSKPYFWATTARSEGVQSPIGVARRRIAHAKRPQCILFGTGHGLAPSVFDLVEGVLPSIQPGKYNHLSVRAAAAILFDRLFAQD